MLHVDRDALLREVVAKVGGADPAAVRIGDGGLRGTARVAAPGRLDLHDLGAEVRHELRRVRQGLHLLEREHANAVEGPSEGAALGMRNNFV